LTIVKVATDHGIRRVLAGKCAACRVLFPLQRGWRAEYAGAFAQAERPNRRTAEPSNAFEAVA
jgi:hypothetical protein